MEINVEPILVANIEKILETNVEVADIKAKLESDRKHILVQLWKPILGEHCHPTLEQYSNTMLK